MPTQIAPIVTIEPTDVFGTGPKCRCGDNNYNKLIKKKNYGFKIVKTTEWKCTNCFRPLLTGRITIITRTKKER